MSILQERQGQLVVLDSRVTLVMQDRLDLLALLVKLVIQDPVVIQDNKDSLVPLEAQDQLALAAWQEPLARPDLMVLLV